MAEALTKHVRLRKLKFNLPVQKSFHTKSPERPVLYTIEGLTSPHRGDIKHHEHWQSLLR